VANTTKLRVENLTKRFGGTVAVNGITFSAQAGEITSLLGPSGCGKTTTLRCIAGLERASEGQIYIDDELVTDGEDIVVPPSERDLGMVFQSYAIWPHMSVEENVGYGLKIRGVDKEERKERISEALELVGLAGLEENSPSQLSGGQQQRVVLARSLAYQPELMLLDEPLANLDAKLRRQMQTEFQNIQEETGVTSIYVTHDQEEGMILSDKMLVMRDGDIVERGKPEILFNQPGQEWSAEFLGKSNRFSVQIDRQNGTARAVLEFGSFDLDEGIDRTDPHLFIRPNNVRFAIDGQMFDEEGIHVKGTIRDRRFLGEFTEFTVDLQDSDTQLDVASTSLTLDMNVSDDVTVFLPKEYCKIL